MKLFFGCIIPVKYDSIRFVKMYYFKHLKYQYVKEHVFVDLMRPTKLI